MSIITKQNFLEPYFALLRKGTPEDPYVNITETIKLVPNIEMDAGVYNTAVLREIPLITQGVVAKIGNDELIEIRDSETEIKLGYFKVDYSNGRVYLPKDYALQEVTFAYKGRGVILITSERILLSYGDKFENLYTLDRYVQEHMGEVNIGELDTLKTQAKDKVVNAINEVYDDIHNHIGNKDNPHETDKADIGLGNVDNTSDATKPVSAPQQTALNDLEDELRTEISTRDEQLQTQIDALEGAYIYIGLINEDTQNITQEMLNNRAKELTGSEVLQIGWVILDNEKHEWYYNGTTWLDLEQSNIYPATNDSMGLVQGNDKVSIINGLMTVTTAENSLKLGGQNASYYGTSEDVNNKVNKDGDTMTGKLILAPTTQENASINIPHGQTPTLAVSGDLWTTTDSINVKLDTANREIYHTGNAPTAALELVSQSEAESGVSTNLRAWNSERVKQAIDSRAWTNETLIASVNEPVPIPGKTIIWIDLS